jgi:hypothetical protein
MQRGIGTLLILFSLACSRIAIAQQTHRENDSAGSIWLAYVGEHPISKQWNLHLEGQFFSYGTQTPELFFLRPGFRRESCHGISGLITYAYFLKYPAITNTSHALPEHRISEDLHGGIPSLEKASSVRLSPIACVWSSALKVRIMGETTATRGTTRNDSAIASPLTCHCPGTRMGIDRTMCLYTTKSSSTSGHTAQNIGSIRTLRPAWLDGM